ncbi:MAG: glycosyltransferase family 2 protein [Flavobacteriales bacterium]
MDVSVIIVNYNVEHFLSQCLLSVRAGVAVLEQAGHAAEVFVVDNNSVDGSCAMVRRQFPEVHLIDSKENLGFSKGNNLAIRQSKGRWVLLLNPDTIIQEDTLLKCLEYADARPRLGGLGVPMVDGAGRYLPESKRGIPTPNAAFWKISGLYRLAPRSARLNRYYLGNLSKDESQPIEILSGAFMWMRASALDEVGLLDEQYFMYGEDIDLSWRLMKGGYENHYFAGTSIVHYKGESTKKGSLNYVLVFYRAMQIFARTHFSGRGGRAMHQVIQLAIYLRAALAIASRVFKSISLPAVEWSLSWAGLVLFLREYGAWQNIRYDWDMALPATGFYALVWFVAVKLQGGYDQPWRWNTVAKGIVIGTVVLLATYGLLPESLRFSRAIFLFGAGMVAVVAAGVRAIFSRFGGGAAESTPKRLYISGPSDLMPMQDLIRTHDVLEPVAFGSVQALSIHLESIDSEDDGVQWLGGLDSLDDAIRIHQFNEIIMSGREVSAGQMIRAMGLVSNRNVRFRIAWTDDGQIVGAGGPERGAITEWSGAIFKPRARRAKRTIDLTVAVLVLLAFPLFILRKQANWLGAATEVLMGTRTWVGYDEDTNGPADPSRYFVFHRAEGMGDRARQRTLLTYVRDYRWTIDVQVIWEALISYRAIHRHGSN